MHHKSHLNFFGFSAIQQAQYVLGAALLTGQGLEKVGPDRIRALPGGLPLMAWKIFSMLGDVYFMCYQIRRTNFENWNSLSLVEPVEYSTNIT